MMRRWRGRRQNCNSVSGSEGAKSAAEGSQQASSVAVTHRDVVDALIGVCKQAGMPLGAVGLFLKPMGDGPAAVLDYRGEDRSAPGYRPSIRVDVSGHARDVIRGSIIDAIIEAAHSEQPQSLFGSFVDPEREKRWPDLRDRGPQRDGLREQLEAVEVATGGHAAVWFNSLARQLGLVAYDAGVAVGINGQAAAESGFQVAWYPSMADPDKPLTLSLSIYLGAFGLDEAVMHAIDLILFGYGVEEGTDEHRRLRQHLREATHEYLRRQLVSENDPVPVTDPKDMQDLTLQLTPGEATGVAAAAASAGVPQQDFMAAAVLEAVCIRAHTARAALAAVRNDTSPDDADAPQHRRAGSGNQGQGRPRVLGRHEPSHRRQWQPSGLQQRPAQPQEARGLLARCAAQTSAARQSRNPQRRGRPRAPGRSSSRRRGARMDLRRHPHPTR